MDLQLTDKIALVVGASKGIGAETAVILAEEGAHVAVTYESDAAGAAETARRIRDAGREAWSIPLDLASPTSIESAFADLRRRLTGLDLLILSAGANRITPFDGLSVEEWDRIVEVNLGGPFRVLREARSLLRDGSSVVAVASVAGRTGAPHHAHYAAAKAGLINLTRSAARAWAPRVRVNCVSPGITLTEMGRRTVEALPEDYAKTRLLVGRFADPGEIARVIAFVASPRCAYMTGSVVDIDGGRLLR